MPREEFTAYFNLVNNDITNHLKDGSRDCQLTILKGKWIIKKIYDLGDDDYVYISGCMLYHTSFSTNVILDKIKQPNLTNQLNKLIKPSDIFSILNLKSKTNIPIKWPYNTEDSYCFLVFDLNTIIGIIFNESTQLDDLWTMEIND